ncbi:MAG: hypothetical protein JWQ23_1643 [Herminiimonas sp.]|nr:hypothetical protein [Herminiimonas sp.]
MNNRAGSELIKNGKPQGAIATRGAMRCTDALRLPTYNLFDFLDFLRLLRRRLRTFCYAQFRYT